MFITHDYSIISEIYARYRQLIPSVHFKELSRVNDDGSVDFHDFSPEDYLRWLKNSAPPRYAVTAAQKEVLRVQPRFDIFGRRHGIYKDSGRVREVPLVINAGEMVYVKAASGVGKTTLAKIIMGLYRARLFSMTLSGRSFTHETPAALWARSVWGEKAGMVFQLADESLDLAANIEETFRGLPLKKKLRAQDILGVLSQLFDTARLTETFLKRKVAHLSGGQKQRLNLLRTLALDCDLIILDEPLNGLDFRGVTRVLGLLEEKRLSGKALLLISHNEEIFDSLVDADHTYYLS
jgi:ABC-type dipeptide/oligopeptide/nickel transport system ATPase subunit